MDRALDILVVAPDAELRRSIAFALEAEGLSVASRPDLPDAPARARCTVVDENAVAAAGGWSRVAGMAAPLVLLVDHLPGVPDDHRGAVLRKPLLGRSLVDAVLAAMRMPELRENP